MLFSHHADLKRDLRNARRVLWWSLVINLFLGALAGFGLSYGMFAIVTCAGSLLSLLFSYLTFLGFSRLAKHFHALRLFWLFVAGFIINAFIAVIDVLDKVIFYGAFDPYHIVFLGLSSLTGAVFAFAYGYLIMDLPEKKFGKLLFRARMWNIALALVTPLMVYYGAGQASGEAAGGGFALAWLLDIILIIVTTVIDYKILGTALRLIGGVLPHPAPIPTRHA